MRERGEATTTNERRKKRNTKYRILYMRMHTLRRWLSPPHHERDPEADQARCFAMVALATQTFPSGALPGGGAGSGCQALGHSSTLLCRQFGSRPLAGGTTGAAGDVHFHAVAVPVQGFGHCWWCLGTDSSLRNTVRCCFLSVQASPEPLE